MKAPRNKRHKKRRSERRDSMSARGLWAPVSPKSSFIDETLAFWQPRTTRALTREDAREMIENVAGFLAILDEWDRAERDAVHEHGETN